MNLLDQFALFSTQIVKLHAELLQSFRPEDSIQARVEIKLSPSKLAVEVKGMPGYQVGVRLSCNGIRMVEDKEEKIFNIECLLNAGYRQLSGAPLSFEQFSQHHSSLTRQLYPIIHHQLIPILSQLGLHNVRLPQDIIHTQPEVIEVPKQVH